MNLNPEMIIKDLRANNEECTFDPKAVSLESGTMATCCAVMGSSTGGGEIIKGKVDSPDIAFSLCVSFFISFFFGY